MEPVAAHRPNDDNGVNPRIIAGFELLGLASEESRRRLLELSLPHAERRPDEQILLDNHTPDLEEPYAQLAFPAE